MIETGFARRIAIILGLMAVFGFSVHANFEEWFRDPVSGSIGAVAQIAIAYVAAPSFRPGASRWPTYLILALAIVFSAAVLTELMVIRTRLGITGNGFLGVYMMGTFLVGASTVCRLSNLIDEVKRWDEFGVTSR